jgi:ribonuclease BN (tRNA processing enzyme)
VVRGPAAGELLAALVEVVRADGVLAILPETGTEREAALALLGMVLVPVLVHPVSPQARRRGRHERAVARTALWDAWLVTSESAGLGLDGLRLTGRATAMTDWRGRQVALLGARGETLGLGEAVRRVGDSLHLRLRRMVRSSSDTAALLVRDARRDAAGLLATEGRGQGGAVAAAIPPELAAPGGEGPDPACFVHLGVAGALLVNGVFGDPLLHIRLRQQRRSLLFDLGDGARLPAKIAHQVSDVFVSHAHMDHIGGFLWFLRSRIGEMGLCRLYGPPGLGAHIAAFIGGIRWDRIGDRGPRFEVRELVGDRVRVTRLRVGLGGEEGKSALVEEGTLLAEPGFRVRAVTLDHGIPVLAFAFEAASGVRIRKERLAAAGLPDGPWLGELKRRLLAGEEGTSVRLPDGRTETAARLARDLVAREPPRRLVYATDLADTAENRARLGGLAEGADVLICEAAFTAADADQAGRTGHLTARACGEIAAAAGVGRLIPFHFSRRYESDPEQVYGEVRAAFGRSLAG